MSQTLHLHVTGMTCGGCEAAVTRALLKIPGVEGVRASHTTESVDLQFDPERAAKAQITAKIESLGYTVGA